MRTNENGTFRMKAKALAVSYSILPSLFYRPIPGPVTISLDWPSDATIASVVSEPEQYRLLLLVESETFEEVTLREGDTLPAWNPRFQTVGHLLTCDACEGTDDPDAPCIACDTRGWRFAAR